MAIQGLAVAAVDLASCLEGRADCEAGRNKSGANPAAPSAVRCKQTSMSGGSGQRALGGKRTETALGRVSGRQCLNKCRRAPGEELKKKRLLGLEPPLWGFLGYDSSLAAGQRSRRHDTRVWLAGLWWIVPWASQRNRSAVPAGSTLARITGRICQEQKRF